MIFLKHLTLLLLPFAIAACDQIDRTAAKQQPTTAPASHAEAPPSVPLVPLAPGGQPPQHVASPQGAQVANDPEQIAAGKQLYSAMNCVGCHFHGGGGMGPPLMDTKWIYGSSIDNIAASIRDGRPNGMPSFHGFLPDEQIWQLAAYVKSLSADAGAARPTPTTTQ
ncbi:c-type cytochrome [Hyphomicrobium sp.]|uniref:c-type cytochrome n=1 Tax=Hyphomicrobium sp. TaxID=82 RepID=UPI002FDF09E7